MSGAFALIGCFGAPFIQYDDSAHIANPAWADRKSDWEFFIPKPSTSYVPLTLMSYAVDRTLHGWWAEKAFGSWAPGVRLDNLLMHGLAALFLWRLLARLRFSETRAFFIALMFACHPTVCETVCWISERKNCMAGMFGFAAIWTQSLVFPTQNDARPPGNKWWRWPVVCILFAASLLGKPSALGLLPILVMIECVALFPGLQARLFRTEMPDSQNLKSAPHSLANLVGIAALFAIALVFLKLNLYTHTGDMVVPPGGTKFTALLTDLEIFSRYLFNFICPIGLSAMYYVEPIVSLGDPRAWLYGVALGGTIGGTIFFARNRWVALFGWCWFFSALSTNANVIAIAHWMQDRYIYLPSPGFWIAISECAAGLSAGRGSERSRRSLAFASIAVLSVSSMAMSASRGFIWSSMTNLAFDATQKQPLSFYAHYAFGGSMDPRQFSFPPDSQPYQIRLKTWRREFEFAVEKCPDADIFNFKQSVAAELGKDAYATGDALRAEHFFKIGATKTPLAPDYAEPHGISLAYLSMLDLYFKRDPEIALEKAKESLAILSSDYGHFALGNAYIACSQRNPHAKVELLNEARKALAEIPKESGLRIDADALLKTIN